jgi:predicted HicB family RNase H-like nuclease
MARKPKKESQEDMSKTTLRLPKDLHKQLKIRAIQQEREMQEVAAEAIAEYLTKTGKGSRGEK